MIGRTTVKCFAPTGLISTQLSVRVRFLLGSAGSGKTFRCLAEICEQLAAQPEGPPLLLIAPKQNTFTLERQLLEKFGSPGFTRLNVLSLERLADFIYLTLGRPAPEMLDEEGRSMVLRGLLARRRERLQLFRASARLTGFARQLSLALHELQRNQVTPDALRTISARTQEHPGLALKLQELAGLFEAYQEWLQKHCLQDAGSLLETVTRTLNESPPGILWESVWVDGFADLNSQEIELLASVVQRSRAATLTFCLDPGQPHATWLSHWWVTHQCLERVERRFKALDAARLERVPLPRNPVTSRFAASRKLAHLEAAWATPLLPAPAPEATTRPESALRLVVCDSPEHEAIFAAREIRKHVRAGGRYRDILVLVRSLDNYHHGLQRAFTRYSVPFFLDRRESVAHHPLAELTRNALRTAAFDWRPDDWFATLKTGLVPATAEEIDRLENEALARGWTGKAWCQPFRLERDPDLSAWVGELQSRLLPPFLALASGLRAFKGTLTGPQLTELLLNLWRQLNVEETLAAWARDDAPQGRIEAGASGTVHASVWSQMNAWLNNLNLAFAAEKFPIKDWLPILEAGLGGLTVGLIPPALDQVLVGTVDRSRNPEGRLAIVLGMNETIFPAAPQGSALLTEADRELLEKRNVLTGASAREQLSRERHFAYLACTRASERLLLSHSLHDAEGTPLNPSPFVSHVRRIFPGLEPEKIPLEPGPEAIEHPCELHAAWLREGGNSSLASACGNDPVLSATLLFQQYQEPDPAQPLAPALAARLYGSTLRTSVSRLEQFAACPFRFFVHSGLRVEERRLFEADFREQGSYQHDLLARFHESVKAEGKRWRDLTPDEARQRVRELAGQLTKDYHEGLLQSSVQNQFLAGVLARAIEEFVATSVEWMRTQYQFEPAAVELPFGEAQGAPAWLVELGDGRKLALRGRIDRVDLGPRDQQGEVWCVVVDYKSSRKSLDRVLVENGLQLQLLGYLNVLRRWPAAAQFFGASHLRPAGVFYVNLRGAFPAAGSRVEALRDPAETRRLAYRHTGRFDRAALQVLDSGALNKRKGDQFNYQLNLNGELSKRCAEPMETGDFNALLDQLEVKVKALGQAIYAGHAAVSPFRKGSLTACEHCDYAAICRVDPWVHKFRVLRKPPEQEPQEVEA